MSVRLRQKGVRKAGWLNKRGGRIHTWHKRWFVLTGDLVFYYKSPQDSRPTGTIPLAGNRVVRHPDDPKQPSSFKFEIVAGSNRPMMSSNHDTYLICADSAEEADAWVAAIRRVMHEPYGGGMFGRSLEETLQVEARLGGAFVPVLLHRCVTFIRTHGIEEVGIFRLPGQNKRVQELKQEYDQGCQSDFNDAEDVHTVASLLKLYLRELPQPVIPFALYESCKRITKSYSERPLEALAELQRIIIQLPQANLNVLQYMSQFLSDVEQHSVINRMNAVNLGTIIGTNFLRPKSNDPQVLMNNSSISSDFVCILISKHQHLFPDMSQERPPKRLSVVCVDEDTSVKWHESKIYAHSLYGQKRRSIKEGRHRPRQNSAPTFSQEQGRNSGKVASMVEQFNARSSIKHSRVCSLGASSMEFILGNIGMPVDAVTTEPRPPSEHVISGPILTGASPLRHGVGRPPSPLVLQNGDASPVFLRNGVELSPSRQATVEAYELEGDDDENETPLMMLTKLASSRSKTDTLSSDIIVNSISKEMEGLEQQLDLARLEVVRFRKAARLWQLRYQQERKARLAAEEQIVGLQNLVDDTFKQFAIDDSDNEEEEDEEEEEEEEEEDTCRVGHLDSLAGFEAGSPSPPPATDSCDVMTTMPPVRWMLDSRLSPTLPSVESVV